MEKPIVGKWQKIHHEKQNPSRIVVNDGLLAVRFLFVVIWIIAWNEWYIDQASYGWHRFFHSHCYAPQHIGRWSLEPCDEPCDISSQFEARTTMTKNPWLLLWSEGNLAGFNAFPATHFWANEITTEPLESLVLIGNSSPFMAARFRLYSEIIILIYPVTLNMWNSDE